MEGAEGRSEKSKLVVLLCTGIVLLIMCSPALADNTLVRVDCSKVSLDGAWNNYTLKVDTFAYWQYQSRHWSRGRRRFMWYCMLRTIHGFGRSTFQRRWAKRRTWWREIIICWWSLPIGPAASMRSAWTQQSMHIAGQRGKLRRRRPFSRPGRSRERARCAVWHRRKRSAI